MKADRLSIPQMTRLTKAEALKLRLVAHQQKVTRSTFIRLAVVRALKEAA